MAVLFSQIRKPVRIGAAAFLLMAIAGAGFPLLPPRTGAPEKWNVSANNEQLWGVRSLLRETARFAAFASGQPSDLWREDAVEITGTGFARDSEWYRVRVRFGAGRQWETMVPMRGEVLDPAAYVPFTRELLKKAHAPSPAPAAAPAARPALATLAFPRAEVIQLENARLSAWLAAAPLDFRAHEEAALLLATLAWREASGVFRDPRDLCRRATAHLILAESVRRGASAGEAGAVAELFVGLAAKTGADHDARLRKLAARAVTSPVLAPWIATAEMARGRDWRPVAGAANPTLLERIELFRAVCRTEGTTRACAILSEREFEDVPDWTRILFEHPFTPVEGRRFSKYALPFETDEMARVFPELADHPAQAPEVAKLLNSSTESLVSGDGPADARVSVIDHGLWGHFLQRHLCHTICRTGDHLRATAAYPETVSAFCASTSIVYRHLKLMPLAAVASGDPAWLQNAAPAVAALLKQHPDWVPEKVWSSFVRQAPVEFTRDLPSLAQWSSAGGHKF